MINLYPNPNANNASAGINYTSQPVRQLDDTRFDTRLDHTFSEKDNAFGRFSYDQAFSFVPGGSPGFAEANAFGSNQRIRNHARNLALGETHVFPPTWSTRPLLVTTASSTTSPRKARGRARPPPSAAAFPTPTWDASTTNACPAHIAAAWFRPSSRAVIGPWAIAATLRSRVEPTSSLSGIPSITSATSMTSGSGSTIALIK